MTSGYREDIDGLRALAVLSVIGFHFEAPRVFGGFVGVDIFFVISGYLITGIIQREMREGTFSFVRFYERRIRRLLPALYVMVAVSAVPTFHYLLASERAEFFRSAIAAVTFTSNIFFWLQSGYFDHAAVEKPLLHTWSLAVEEQFYLALPPLLWAVLLIAKGRRWALPAALAIVGIASLLLSMWLIAKGQSSTAFFLSPPRAWEFLIGSVIAIEGFPVLNNRPVQHGIRTVAVVMILIPVFTYNEDWNFPGYRALLPCAGAALFIWCGTGIPNRVRHPLSFLSVLRFCGQISYSLYLWHWPLFDFARFSKSSLTLNLVDKTLLFALTVAISYLSWRFVEQPFRDRSVVRTRKAAFGLAGIATLFLVGGSVAGILASRGESDRAAQQLEAYVTYDYRLIYRRGSCFSQSGEKIDAACITPAAGKQNILLWGDSLAAHLFHGLSRTTDPEVTNVMQATQAACMPTLNAAAQGNAACRTFAAQMQDLFAREKPDLVVLSGDWLEYARPPRFDGMIADLKTTIGALTSRGIRVVLVGPAVQFRSRLPAMLLRLHLRQAEARADDLQLSDVFALDAKMKQALPASDGFSYVSVLDAMCPARQCPALLEGGVPLAWDHAHLTAEGSVAVMQELAPIMGLKKR